MTVHDFDNCISAKQHIRHAEENATSVCFFIKQTSNGMREKMRRHFYVVDTSKR